jgi:hypothetical protein
MRYLLLLIPTCLLGGCLDREDDPREAYAPHMATSWTVTAGGVTRDAGPFQSVEKGYLASEDIDLALDLARQDFCTKFPEYAWVNPLVHLTDDYVFWVTSAGWAAGQHLGNNQISLAIWSRISTEKHPGDHFIVRPPGDSFGTYYTVYRHTGLKLIPAYQHECLHVAIGDPTHSSPLWNRL